MNAFILQTIALSLGVFLLGLFLGWLLKKLFCKNKSKIDSYNRDGDARADPSFATSNTQSEVDNTDKSIPVATKAAGVTAAVAGAATMAKSMSKDGNHIESISAIDSAANNVDQAIDTIKEKTEAVSDFGEQVLDKAKNELPNGDNISNIPEETLDNIQASEASDVDETIDKLKTKAEMAVESGGDAIEKIKSELPNSETLTEELEDIKSIINDKAENLQDTADKGTEEVTSLTDSLDAAKTAATAIAGVAATVAGASLANEESSDEAIEKVKNELPDSDTLSEELDDIKATINNEAENLQDTADKGTEEVTSSTDSLDAAKTAATAIAGVAASVAGASLANEQKKDSADISVEEKNNQATSGSASNKISKTGSHTSKRDIDYTAVNTVHRTLRRRHRSCRCRK